MPNVRRVTGSTLNMSSLIIGCVLVGLVVLGFLQQHLQKRKRRTQYHPSLQLQQSSKGVLEHIGKRKEDLIRYIGNLKEQLAAREDQLRYHDELEEIVTSRVDTDRRDKEEWAILMKAGKKMYGDNWDSVNEDECSLRELMELHKEELLEYKRSLQNQPKSSRQHFRAKKQSPVRPPSESNSSLLSDAISTPTQWRSTRARAGSLSSVVSAQFEVSKDKTTSRPPAQTTPVPALDLSRITSKATVNLHLINALVEPAKKEERNKFEAKFQRQTRLAAMLRKD